MDELNLDEFTRLFTRNFIRCIVKSAHCDYIQTEVFGKIIMKTSENQTVRDFISGEIRTIISNYFGNKPGEIHPTMETFKSFLQNIAYCFMTYIIVNGSMIPVQDLFLTAPIKCEITIKKNKLHVTFEDNWCYWSNKDLTIDLENIKTDEDPTIDATEARRQWRDAVKRTRKELNKKKKRELTLVHNNSTKVLHKQRTDKKEKEHTNSSSTCSKRRKNSMEVDGYLSTNTDTDGDDEASAKIENMIWNDENSSSASTCTITDLCRHVEDFTLDEDNPEDRKYMAINNVPYMKDIAQRLSSISGLIEQMIFNIPCEKNAVTGEIQPCCSGCILHCPKYIKLGAVLGRPSKRTLQLRKTIKK